MIDIIIYLLNFKNIKNIKNFLGILGILMSLMNFVKVGKSHNKKIHRFVRTNIFHKTYIIGNINHFQ